jgi:hypothetical protein
MQDYRNINWDQEKPTSSQLDAEWSALRVTALDRSPAEFVELVGTVNHTHDNGGAFLGRFLVSAGPAWTWYLSRNRLEEAGFFRRFFQHPVVATAFPGLGPIDATVGDLPFKNEEAHVVTGRLAGILASGGAYGRYEEGDKELLRIVRSFIEAAFEERYSDVRAYTSWAAYSPWFKDVAWDSSFFWFDLRDGVATVLLVTDTD